MKNQKIKDVVTNEKIGIISNTIFSQMLGKDLNLFHIPYSIYDEYIHKHQFKTVMIEIEIYEQDHSWYNKNIEKIFSYLKENDIEVIILTDIHKVIPVQYYDYNKIIIDNTIEDIIIEDKKITIPLLVNEELINPKDSSLEYDITFFKFDDFEFPSEMTEYLDKFKPNKIISSVAGISSGLLNSLANLIKKTNIVYIFDDKRIDRLVIEYLKIISTLQNSIVIINSNNYEDDIIQMRAYLKNNLYREKYIIPRIRNLFYKNTFVSRNSITDILTMGSETQSPEIPKISVVVSTQRKLKIKDLIDQLNNQKLVELEIILLTHGFELDQNEKNDLIKLSHFNLKLLNESANINFGECLNKCLSYITTEFFIKIDDDDFYLPNFIIDLWIGLRYSGATIVGKNAFFFYLESENMVGQRRTQNQYKNFKEVKGNTIFCHSKTILEYKFGDLQRHVDSDVFERIRKDDGLIYAIHPFDMCVFRAQDKSGHTYQVEDSRFLRDAKMLYNGKPNSTISTD